MSERTTPRPNVKARKPVMRSVAKPGNAKDAQVRRVSVKPGQAVPLPPGVTSSGQFGLLQEIANRVLIRDAELSASERKPALSQMREQHAIMTKAVEHLRIFDALLSSMVECNPGIDWIGTTAHRTANAMTHMVREWADEVLREMAESVGFTMAMQEEAAARAEPSASQPPSPVAAALAVYTDRSNGRDGFPVRVGDVVRDVTGRDCGGRVIAVAGHAVIFVDRDGQHDFDDAENLAVLEAGPATRAIR